MGLLSVRSGKRTYFIEFEKHGSTQTELPIEKLRAVFLETNGAHGTSGQEIADCLNQHNRVISMRAQEHGPAAKNVLKKHREIIERAKKRRIEIWLGDVPVLRMEYALDFMFAPLRRRGFDPALALSEPGDARKRRKALQEAIAQESAAATQRSKIMAHKVNFLAKLTGNARIGILIGGGHPSVAKQVKITASPTGKEKREYRQRGEHGLKIYRCIYEKAQGRWRVEAHSL